MKPGPVAHAELSQPSPQDWRDIMALLDIALELDPASRSDWLASLGPAHSRLEPMLTALLHDLPQIANSDFLQTPAHFALDWPASPPALAPGALVGPYRLLREIGQGGMASVWLAERADGLLERPVALKLPHLSWGSGSLTERMARERQILASLTHPNIARLYDVGNAADGRPFLALEYVDGQPIDRHAVSSGLSIRERVVLIVQVARAVAHAHAQLVVHRDLKPSNILVDAQGCAHLLDFGIARLIETTPDSGIEAPPATLMPGRALTPDYASPEQIRGDPLGTGSDIYSMGVLAFELLAGVRPYRLKAGLGAAALAEAIAGVDIPLASHATTDESLRRQLRGDLDAILVCALAKSSDERYATIDAFANDLEHHLRGEPVAARGRPRLYLLGRLLKRHRWAVGGAALLVASLATGLVATLWQARRAEAERDVARRAVAGRDAVIEQLISLFRTSLAQRGDSPPTARAMLDASAKNLLSAYRDNPALLGRVIVALADLFHELEDLQGQAALLEGFLAQAGPDADRESVALAEQELAFVEVKRGHFQKAAAGLQHAEAIWASEPAKYREQRIGWLQVRATLLQDQGDLDGAIVTLQTAVAESAAYLGAAGHGTPDLYNSLGIALSRANRMEEALVAYRSSLDMAAKFGESESADALVTLANLGSLDYQTGQLRQAEDTLRTAIDKQRLRTGDSAALAAAMGWYGATLTALGRSGEAIAVLREGTAMAFKFTGTASPMAIRDRLFLVDALTEAGQLVEARELTAATGLLTLERFGEAAPLTLRTRLALARIDLAAGRPAVAEAGFRAIVEPLRRAGLPGQTSAAQALMGSGEALLAQGKAAEAVTPLRQAVDLRQKLSSDQNWELALARCRLGEALKRSHGSGGTALLQQGLAVLAAQLGEGHSEVERVRRLLVQPS